MKTQQSAWESKQKDINKSEFDKMMAGQWYNAMDYSMLKLRQEK